MISFWKATKKFASLLGASALVMCSAVPAYATGEGTTEQTATTEEEQSSTARIKATYASSITPAEGDVFVMTYRVAGGEETAEISVDASIISDATGYIELPAANYEILSIDYQGQNSDIIMSGYACVGDFVADTDGGTFIYIGVGNSAAQSIANEYYNAVITQPWNTVSTDEGYIKSLGEKAEEADGESGEPEGEEEIESITPDVVVEETLPVESPADEEETPAIIYEKTEEQETTQSSSRWKNIGIRLCVLVVVFVIGMVVIFVLHKMGKI
jgi:hypothetical protein